MHVHFLPPRMLAAVWAYFDQAGEHYGVDWPVTYRVGDEQRVALLRGSASAPSPRWRTRTSPGWRAWLNDWTLELRRPDARGCVPSATFFPEPEAAGYVAVALGRRARGSSRRTCRSAATTRPTRCWTPVWGRLAEARVPVVVHCGSGPVPGAYTGLGPIGEVLRRHPRLRLVVAHAGMPEYRRARRAGRAVPAACTWTRRWWARPSPRR